MFKKLCLLSIISILLSGFSIPTKPISTSSAQTQDSVMYINDEVLFAYMEMLDIQKFLDLQNSPLKNYQEENQGEYVAAATAISFHCEMFGINPQIVLTLLEVKTHLLTDPESENRINHAFGNTNLKNSSFISQLRWVMDELTQAYFAFLDHENQDFITFQDGTTTAYPAGINAATYAMMHILAENTTYEAWSTLISTGEHSFYDTFLQLFGDFSPTAEGEERAPEALTGLRLPWGNSETWYFTSGPHTSTTGGVRYSRTAVDFAPGGGSGCFSSSAWVRAVKAGTVAVAHCNYVRINHGGGWSTTYFHLSSIQVSAGQSVSAGTRLGHPSCGVGASCGWRGSATGSHVHFDTRYNYVPQRIDGTLLGGWTIHQGSADRRGTMTCGSTTKTASVYKNSNNSIRAYVADTDTDDGRTLTSGQTITGTRNPGNDEDVYYLNASSGQILTVEMWKTSGSSLDTYIYVKDPNGRTIGVDDDGGTGYNSRLVVTLSVSGRYRIFAKGYSTSTGAYGLKATLTTPANDDDEDGAYLSHDRTRDGVLNSNSDNDIFYFNGVAGRLVSIRMWKDGSSVDTYLELYKPDGTRLTYNDDGGAGSDSWIVIQLPTSGTYRIKARSWNHSSSGAYQIRLRMIDANNYAAGKSVYASSVENSNFTPRKCVDGNLYTRWSSRFSDRQWLYVNLGTTRTVDMVSIRWETAYAKRFGVYVWTGSYWKNVYWTNNGRGGTNIIRFSAQNTRYVLISAYERGTPWGVSIWEFGVYNSTLATPPTPEPEDPTKTSDTIPIEMPPAPTSDGKEEELLALTIGDDGDQEFLPDAETWIGETVDANTTSAGTPLAFIDSIDYDDTITYGDPVTYEFIGTGADTDSEGTRAEIVAYEWTSDIDGFLSDQSTFSLASTALTNGLHTITFRVQDNEGLWSDYAIMELDVIHFDIQIYIPTIIR
jgi:murein DD-endopeptidase MepM/ murein hydrolase activator NlpD